MYRLGSLDRSWHPSLTLTACREGVHEPFYPSNSFLVGAVHLVGGVSRYGERKSPVFRVLLVGMLGIT